MSANAVEMGGMAIFEKGRLGFNSYRSGCLLALAMFMLSACTQTGDTNTGALSSVVEENRQKQTEFEKAQKAALEKQQALFREQRQKQLALAKPGEVKNLARQKSVVDREGLSTGAGATFQKASVTAPGRSSNITANAPWKCVPDSLKIVLNEVSHRYGPVTVNSTHRSRSKNRRVGGASHSYHLNCQAVDFRVKGNQSAVMKYLRSHPNVGGLKRYRSGFIHIDTGPRRSWR